MFKNRSSIRIMMSRYLRELNPEIVAFLARHPGVGMSEIARSIRRPHGSIEHHLDELCQSGRVFFVIESRRIKHRRHGAPARWYGTRIWFAGKPGSEQFELEQERRTSFKIKWIVVP